MKDRKLRFSLCFCLPVQPLSAGTIQFPESLIDAANVKDAECMRLKYDARCGVVIKDFKSRCRGPGLEQITRDALSYSDFASTVGDPNSKRR